MPIGHRISPTGRNLRSVSFVSARVQGALRREDFYAGTLAKEELDEWEVTFTNRTILFRTGLCCSKPSG